MALDRTQSDLRHASNPRDPDRMNGST